MAVILILYTVLNILVFGFVVLFARASRMRTRANERVDLEDNSIMAEEWALIRRLQCLPSGCPRTVGTPPRPRKDVTCEICAALFMERYWQERLGASPAETGTGSRGTRDTGSAPLGLADAGRLSLHASPPGELLAHRERREPIRRQIARGRRLYALGLGCVVAGAVVGILSSFGVLSGIIAGYLLVITGIGCLVAGAASGFL
jgi:hypothetical protein